VIWIEASPSCEPVRPNTAKVNVMGSKQSISRESRPNTPRERERESHIGIAFSRQQLANGFSNRGTKEVEE